MTKLVRNIHECCVDNYPKNCMTVKGNYDYFHYLCDGFDDRGWGCGYRTLQTICSWMKYNIDTSTNVPEIKEIQEILVKLEDKPKSFLGSKQWIGSFEVCLVLDKLYDVPCKILHISNGNNLTDFVGTIQDHFVKFGSPVMMGGDVDCSSKGIMGIKVCDDETSLLVVDPHYTGEQATADYLKSAGWVKWQPLQAFIAGSFYNLCLPQVKSKHFTSPSK